MIYYLKICTFKGYSTTKSNPDSIAFLYTSRLTNPVQATKYGLYFLFFSSYFESTNNLFWSWKFFKKLMQNWQPSMTGMFISQITRSQFLLMALLYPSNPFQAVSISIILSFFIIRVRIFSMKNSSFISKTLIFKDGSTICCKLPFFYYISIISLASFKSLTISPSKIYVIWNRYLL